MNIGITCYPSVGGSGILATSLGVELAARGHQVHFISYERPVRLEENLPGVHFHPVSINDYGLFRYLDYTLPLSVRMAQVSQEHSLDLLHVHYAVPHATAALLARAMLTPRPRIVTTLHGTDTTLLGRDPAYAPAIRFALERSDAVTAVSHWLREETVRLLQVERPIEVIHNFYTPHSPRRSRAEVRDALGLRDEGLVLHSSNLRSPKGIGLLLETAARINSSFKLVVLAGGDFGPFRERAAELGVTEKLVVVEHTSEVEDYLAAADVNLITSRTESFCLSILEAMYFACPSVATSVGGIPEVIEDGESGLLRPFGDAGGLALAVDSVLGDRVLRDRLGLVGQERAQSLFSARRIVGQYEELYERVLAASGS